MVHYHTVHTVYKTAVYLRKQFEFYAFTLLLQLHGFHMTP